METRMNFSHKTVFLTWLVLNLSIAYGQTTNDITAVNPNSAIQLTTGQTITFTLDTDDPPAPPAGVIPESVTIGTIEGASATHPDQYTITAVFDFPADEAPGTKDVSISFITPEGDTLIFFLADGFTILEAADMPPTITQSPRSQTVVFGRSVTLTVIAWGTNPLSYQWTKDDVDIPDTNSVSYTIESVTYDDAAEYFCIVTNAYGSATSESAVLTVVEDTFFGTYPIVDTGQVECYDDTVVIAAPALGEAFYGQDAQYDGYQPNYTLSDDGLSVTDNITGLTWTQSPDLDKDGDIDADDKLTQTEALSYPDTLNAQNYGGYDDWRLPTIKELYSLIMFNGAEPSPNATSTAGCIPFIDTSYFNFGYGDLDADERIIDAQFASSTLYVSTTMGGNETMFGLNLADGRIKGYPTTNKTYYVYFVRGNTHYGINSFVDNGDGTISDKATGLMWAQNDSGAGLNWQEALAWVQTKNAESYLGYDNWRLPNTKELHSIVDYTRSPATTNSAAIDPLFNCTQITNEAGEDDYPFYWTSTTHCSGTPERGESAVYISFGKAMGYMAGLGGWIDVHGAGAQRSDPKSGNPSDWPTGHGPQGDAIRIYNYVHLVRDI
jgi:hypothetical protein